MKRFLTRLNPRTAKDLAAVRQRISITEDAIPGGRVWHLSCGQMIDLVVNDNELACIAHGLSIGLDIEAACQRTLLARP